MIRGGPSGPPLSFRHRTDFEGKFRPLISFTSSSLFFCHSPISPSESGSGRAPGGTAVVYYRLYLLNPANGRFIGFEEIEAPDDVEAVHLALEHCGSQPLELWCGKRKVKSFPARSSAAEA